MKDSDQIDSFIKLVVNDHSFAEGIKTLSSNYEIVAYACSNGFLIDLAAWARFVAMDWLQSSDSQLTLAIQSDPTHWSWAFRQVSTWRSLLMDGVNGKGLLDNIEVIDNFMPQNYIGFDQTLLNSNQSLNNSQMDSNLDSFISYSAKSPELIRQICEATIEDEVIALADSLGYKFDSLTILRRWSKHTDFSKPTWYGWFDTN